MVSSLIDPTTRWWNVDTIRALFLPFEAATVLKIPLSYNLPEDKLIWIGNKRGEFSVKSAYFIASNLLDKKDKGECSNGNPNAQLWKKLWSLNLPAKIKIFSWRACVDGLPVLTKLAARGLQISCDCPICDEEPETLLHALISCDFALSVWSLWQDCPLESLLKTKDFADLMHQICSCSTASHLELFCSICWSIWYNRNLCTHGENRLPPLQIWEMARNTTEDFQEAYNMNFSPMQPTQGGWPVPPGGFFKINVDGAASIDDLGTSGVSDIIRDEEGSVIAALCKALPLHYPAELTEVFALEQGVLLAQEMTLSNVIFESDASSVIQAVSQGFCGGELGHLIQGILLAKSSFAHCTFQHVKRTYNRAAHELAQLAKRNQVNMVWKGVTPPLLEHLIQSGLG